MTGTVRALTCCLLAAALAASVVGCAEEEKPVTLPSLTPHTVSPTPTTTIGLTDAEQVEAIYFGYARGVHRAERMKDDAERKEYLAQWLDDPALADRVKRTEEFREAGYETTGTPEPHVAKTTISRSEATIRTCTDERQLITKNLDTGETTRGIGVWQVFELRRTDRGWRIIGITVGKNPCDPDKY